MEKRAPCRGKGALSGVVNPKNIWHYFGVALFEVALIRVLLYPYLHISYFHFHFIQYSLIDNKVTFWYMLFTSTTESKMEMQGPTNLNVEIIK